MQLYQDLTETPAGQFHQSTCVGMAARAVDPIGV
jgi:hypothetical protein